MPEEIRDSAILNTNAGMADGITEARRKEVLLKTGALQIAILNSTNFSSIATDEKGVIQIFNVGAECMLGYAAADVLNKITPADISDPQELITRAKALSVELSTPIAPGFEALVFKASRGIEDIYELTYIRKDGSRLPAVVSVTALCDDQNAIIGYLLIGTDNTARKQAEEEQKQLGQRLREQQFYTRSLLESNIDALVTTDPSGIITDVNKQMEALTGCRREELIGASFKNYFTDPERAEAGIKLVLEEKKVTNYELTARSRDGKKTVVSFNATTFYDRDRKLQGVFAAARDITERKQAEVALAEERNLLNILMDNLPDMIYFKDVQSRIIRSNQAHARRVGLNDPAQMVGKTDFDLFAEEHAREAYEDEQEIMRSDQPLVDKEEKEIFKDGHVFWVSTTKMPLRDQQGQIVGTFGISRDTTERKQAEAALRQSEARFRAIFEHANDAIHIDSAEDQILDANQRTCEIFGYSRDELLHMHIADLQAPEVRNLSGNVIQNEYNLHGNHVFESQNLHCSGRRIPVEISVARVESPQGGLYISIVRDITERKQAEEALQKSASSLQAVLQSTADGIMAVESENEVLYANERFAEMWQIPPAVMASKNDSILLRHVLDQLNDPESFLKEVQELYKSTKESSGTLNFKDGRVFERLSRPLMQGAVVRGRVWSFRDITAHRQSEKLQNAIYRISRAADQAKSLDSLYPSIHAIIQEVMAAGNFYIALYDEKNDLLSFPYSVDERDPHFPPGKPGKGLTEYVLRTGKTVLCDEALYQGLIQRAEIELVGAHSPIWLGTPLIVEGKTLGVMVVQDYKNDRAYGERELHMLEFVSTQVALAIERKRLEEEIRSLSLTDELTGLYNRRGFTLLAEQEVKKAYRMKRSMLLLFTDVDYLKTINDTWGHAQGDLALQEISAILKESLREADILARIGGDEFVVLALDTSKENAEIMTSRLQAALEARNQQSEKTYHLTLSMGVAHYDPTAPCTLSELLAQADSLMYEQKQARR